MNNIDIIINKFETERFKDKKSSKSLGVFYTPWKIVNFIVSNAFKIYFEELFQSPKSSGMKFDYNEMKHLLNENKSFRSKLKSEINTMKILDPASGSGRFLISAANFLYNIYKLLYKNQNDFSIKKKIIQTHLYGIDIDHQANIISNLRLANWLYEGSDTDPFDMMRSNLKILNIKKKLNQLDIRCNLFDEDFLLDFNQRNFSIILGNPPYIENKKITDPQFKKHLNEKFVSAYKLFDLSVIFIEKSINILDQKNGVLSFLTTNKFLAADYGIKIREIILKNTQIREIINISSLNSFKQISTYPIILFLKRGPNDSNFLSIQKFETIEQFSNHRGNKIHTFSQEKIQNFPKCAIPLSGNIELIDYIYSKYKKLSEVFKDLKITYRPFGFIDWVKESKNIIEKSNSYNDLILLGTGNVNRYHIDFDKYIKVAKNKYFHPFFQYGEKYRNIWTDLSSEKLIFREIAKNLSFVYDPGVFVNLTGLYFLQVSSFNTDQLFGLLTILNSEILNTLFKSLYGTLHMSSGYLRFNGSFIKNLPIPGTIPNFFSNLGKILHFLSQLKFELIRKIHYKQLNEIRLDKIEILLEYYNNLTNFWVNKLYLNPPNDSDFPKELPNFCFKFIFPHYHCLYFKHYSSEEINQILNDIISFFIKSKGHGLDINQIN